jgi:hypothetical protein
MRDTCDSGVVWSGLGFVKGVPQAELLAKRFRSCKNYVTLGAKISNFRH